MAKSGAIYTNGIVLEKHEQATIKILADNGYDVTLIRPSTTHGYCCRWPFMGNEISGRQG